jgi:hypothetical protein
MKKWQRLLSSKGTILAITASFAIVLLPLLALDVRWG